MIYLDANCVIAATVRVEEEERTLKMQRLARQHGAELYVSPWAEYEARKYLHGSGAKDWETDLDGFLTGRRLAGNWTGAVAKALRLAREFRARLAVDSADVLHVGWALLSGAGVFASFDRHSGPRALALCAGLKVFPVPEAKDFEAMSKLKS